MQCASCGGVAAAGTRLAARRLGAAAVSTAPAATSTRRYASRLQSAATTVASCTGGSRRAFSAASGGIDRKDEKPDAFHLEHVQQRVEHTIPQMFRERLDYTFYRKDVVLYDQILNVRRFGRDALMQHMGALAFAGCFLVPHIEAEPLQIVPMLEDGTVRVRWRVKYISFPRLLMDPKLLRREYRHQNLSWFDGLSVLTVDGNGDVYSVTLQRLQRDDEPAGLLKDSTKKLAQKMGVLPGANASFQRASEPGSDKDEGKKE